MLVIAISKGRFFEPSLDVLARSGASFGQDLSNSRKLVSDSADGCYRAILVKPIDVPTYVEYGAADIGIAGRDVLMESQADLLQPLDLNFGHCRIVVAVPKGMESVNHVGNPTVRVATKYPQITQQYFKCRGIPVEIIRLSGSVELAPLIGLADRIVDLVETGQTLKDNGLRVMDVIAESSARLLVNRAGYQTKRNKILELIHSLEKVVSCASST